MHSTIATSYYESLSPTVILYADNNNDISSELKNILDHKKNSSIQTIICVENIDWSISTDPNILINRLKNTNIIDLFPTIQHPADWYSYKIEWEANFLNNRGKKSNDVYDPDYLMQKYVVDNQLPDLKKHPENFQHNYAADNNIYFGQSHIHTGIADLYKEKLASLLNSEQTSIDHLSRNDNSSYSDVREFVTELTNQVDRLSLLEITLNDFNNTFMQRSSALSIMALIPNGFLPHQELAKEINSLFNEFEADVELLNPNPYSHFSPIKDGAFRINKLRIVDTFGRSKLAHVQQTHTTQQLQIQNKANWLALPPRLAQPACIHADWIDSNNIDSPVFGWFMINLIDLRLECYEYDGKHIGSFISNGNWEISPFQKHLASQTFDSEFSFLNHNRDLQQVMKWFNSQMINSDRLSFFKTLFEQITLSLSYIEPENYENPTLMESITTTPLALTKVSINLFVKGGPLHDLNKENFKDFIEGNQQRNCSEYDAIKFPISIGDYTQYHNSCVGYWHIQQLQDYPASNCCLYFNNPEFVTLYSERVLDTHNKYAELMRLDLLYRNDKSDHISIFLEKLRLTDRGNKICKTDFLDAYIIEGERIWNLLMEMHVIVGTSLTSMLTSLSNNQYQGNEIHGLKLKQIDDNAYLTINKNLRERLLFMILHPKGKLHIKSGILPQHEIQLPYSKIKHALNRLELTLYAGLVLTPKNQLEISLTKDKSYLWSWINIQKPPYPYRNRTTQLRSLDLNKVDLPISITDLEELIQRLTTSRLILTTKPTKSQHEHIYIVNPNYSFASQLQLTKERTIQEFLMQKSHKTFLRSFEQHFHHDNRIYEFHSAFDLEKFKRLFENGFIEYFPLFVNKKYVLLTEFGYTVKNNNNLFIQLNLLDQEDLSSLRPCSESHYELRSADLVEIDSELLNQLNVQLVKKRYLKSSLLKHDDFYKSEDIYFIIEESFNLTEQLVANIALYKDLKLQLLGKPLSTITIEVPKIWNILKALKNLQPLIHPISTMNVQLQVIDKIQSFIIHDNVVQIIQELTQIEDLLLQHTSDANRDFMRIQQTIEKLTEVEITSQSFDDQWASNVEVFNLINNNISAISTIQDFNYSNVHIPTTVLKEGWLSIKTSLNQL